MDKWTTDSNKLFDNFQKEFPLSKIKIMTLDEYTKAGATTTFIYWLEKKLDELGSIWGGSSFKFGIYNRKDKKNVSSNNTSVYQKDYAWYRKYGTDRDQVFNKVKSLIVEVIEAVQSGNLNAIDDIDLGTVYKWKIAFHYQDPTKPLIIPIFKLDAMQLYFKSRDKKMSSFQKKFHGQFKTLEEAFRFSQKVWKNYIV